MVTRRRGINAYTDDSPDTTRAICSKCYDKGIEVFLVPYIMENGKRDDHFKRCPECGAIIRRQMQRQKSETQPLGSRAGLGETKFEVISKRRHMRQDNPREDLKQEVPKFGLQRDRDLEAMVNEGAIITSISDSFIDEEIS